MKLNPKGNRFSGEMTPLDERIMRVQYQFHDEGLNIWGEEDCGRCGACCYAWGNDIKDKFEHCEYLDSTDCKLHEDNKPPRCQAYRCYGFDYEPSGSDLQRLQLMLVAVDILKTRTSEDIQGVAQTPIKKRQLTPPKELFEKQVQKALSKVL